jgi:hypothetical protein
MSKKTIFLLLAFVAINAMLFGAYHVWSTKHRAKLDEINAVVANARAAVDESTKAIALSHKSMVDMEAKLNKMRITLNDIEWRYPRGAPADVVKKYNDQVAEHNQLLRQKNAAAREHNAKVAAHSEKLKTYNQRVTEANAAVEKARNPFSF